MRSATRPGIAFHRAYVPADERTIRDGIPLTAISRTLLDLAAAVPGHKLQRAMNEAEVQRLTDTLSLHDLSTRYPRRAGAPAVRAALESLPQAASSCARKWKRSS